MNPQITALSINSIGLVFDIIGAVLVASEVVYQYKGKRYKENPTWQDLAEQTKSEEYVRHEKINYRTMKFGLGFLLAGFLLQLTAQWYSFFSVPTIPNFHQQIEWEQPQKKCTNCHNPQVVINLSQLKGNDQTNSATTTEKDNNQTPPNENPIK